MRLRKVLTALNWTGPGRKRLGGKQEVEVGSSGAVGLLRDPGSPAWGTFAGNRTLTVAAG